MENSAGRLLLVDGSNLLFQMFYGMPARLRTNRLLIRLSGDEPLPFSPDTLAVSLPERTTGAVLTAIGLK